MALRIITGTVEGSDPNGLMLRFQREGTLNRKYLLPFGKVGIEEASELGLGTVSRADNTFKIFQTTSVGKTTLGCTLLYHSYIRGKKIAANTPIFWEPFFGGQMTFLKTMEMFKACRHTHIMLDDFKRVIRDHKDKLLPFVSEIVNEAGKKDNQLDIVVQRIVFAPPDIRDIADELIVPWVTIADATDVSPRGGDKYPPVEIVPLRFTPGGEFIGVGGFGKLRKNKSIRYDTGVGREIMGGFDTLYVAETLKGGEVRQ